MNYIIPIIIPSYDPDERFIQLLENLKSMGVEPIVVVNDGSSKEYDYFFERAKNDYGAIVIKHEKNMGKGKALKTAFSYCLENYNDMLGGCITADSDGQHTTSAILHMKEILIQNIHSLVLGVRKFDGDDVPVKSQFGNNLTRKVFKALYKKDISDTQTGLRGIPTEFMRSLLLVSGDRFEFETRMLISAVENQIEIVETCIETIYDSKENHSTHFRPIVDSIRIYRVFGFAFGKYLLSSLSSSIVDLTIFQMACVVLKKSIASIQYIIIATIIARIISAIYNYTINYYFVFKSKETHIKSAVKYFILAVLQMVCSAGLTTGLISILKINIELYVKIPVDLVLFFLSYQIQKRFIYL